MKKTFFEAVMVGAMVEEKIAKQFSEKCSPHNVADVIEGFIYGICNGDISISNKEEAESEAGE